MKFLRSITRLVAVVAVAALMAAACGDTSGGGDGNQASGDTATPDESPEVESSEDSANENDAEDDDTASEDDASQEGASGDASDGDSADENADDSDDADTESLTLLTHDSFAVSDGTLEAFTEQTGIEVTQLAGGDAGELVAKAILSAGAPEGDVLFGIDNTFLQRGLDANVFLPYESPTLAVVPDEFELDDEYRVTPIDVGDVCVNYWTDSLPGGVAPESLADLTKPEFASSFVTQNPESSSPGFAFLLATIEEFGDPGWEQYWEELRDGGMTVTAGWSDAYYGDFVAGGGERSLVTSYASSPVAEVVFAEEPIDSPPTGVLTDSCFRQIEFAGILDGTENEAGAQQLIDFMLSDTFQSDIPLNMFVEPVNSTVELPESFLEHGVAIDNPRSLSPEEIEENRADWTDRWVEIVLR